MRLFSSGSPLRDPFPFDLLVNGTGVMTLDEAFDSAHPTPLGQVSPSEFSPSAQNPAIESSHEWRDFSKGFGARMDEPGRYRFTSRLDASIKDMVFFGPKLNTLTPSSVDATNGISGFFEIGGVLYVVNGRYVHKRTSDSDFNTGRKDLGVGKAALDHKHFFTNVAAGADYVYVAMGDSELMWKFDGTTWTQHATMFARAFESQGKELWRSPGTNTVAKCTTDADPWLAGSWTAPNQFNVGDKTSNINRLIVNKAGTMIILKTDGVYALNDVGKDIPLFKFPIDSENGLRPYLSENYLYATMGKGHYRYDPNMTQEQIGPELAVDNDTPVRGVLTTGVETPFANYCGLYNPDTGDSYLMKFGAWRQDQDGEWQRFDAWHGSLSAVSLDDVVQGGGFGLPANADFSGKKITAMHLSAIGATSGYQRCYIGCSDGSIYWFQLPLGPNPTVSASYAYPLDSYGHIFPCLLHCGFPNEEKNARAITVTADQVAGTFGPGDYRWVQDIYLRTAGDTAAPTGYGGATASTALASAVPGKRTAINRVFTTLESAIRLSLGASATAGKTPILNGAGISYSVHPPLALVRGPFHVLAEDGLRNREGRPLNIGADEIRSAIKTAAGLAAGVTVVQPDETSETLELKAYQEHTVITKKTKRYRQVISFIGVTTDRTSGAGVVALS